MSLAIGAMFDQKVLREYNHEIDNLLDRSGTFGPTPDRPLPVPRADTESLRLQKVQKSVRELNKLSALRG